MRTIILDQSEADLVSDLMFEVVSTEGFSPEESLPGLARLAAKLIQSTSDPDLAFEEFSLILTDEMDDVEVDEEDDE